MKATAVVLSLPDENDESFVRIQIEELDGPRRPSGNGRLRPQCAIAGAVSAASGMLFTAGCSIHSSLISPSPVASCSAIGSIQMLPMTHSSEQASMRERHRNLKQKCPCPWSEAEGGLAGTYHHRSGLSVATSHRGRSGVIITALRAWIGSKLNPNGKYRIRICTWVHNDR